MWTIELTLLGGGKEKLRYKTEEEARRILATMPARSTMLAAVGWDDDHGRTGQLSHGVNLIGWAITSVKADEAAAAAEEWIRSAGRGTTTEHSTHDD